MFLIYYLQSMKYLIVIIIAFTLSSCFVMQNGSTSSGPLLSIADKKVDKAFGKARTVFVFGIGRHKRDYLVEEAQSNLYVSRPVKSNEYYSNFTCNVAHKLFLFGIIFVTKTTVTADVLKSATAPEPRPLPYITDTYFINEIDSFNIGEEIYYKTIESPVSKYKIVSISPSMVKLKSDTGKPDLEVKAKDVFYSMKKNVNGFKPGNDVRMRIFIFYDTAKLAAINNTEAVLNVDGEYYVRPISKIRKD